MDFKVYQYLAKNFLEASYQRENIFAHLFLVLCWNLICRAGNVVSICLNHIEWREDALCIFFAHMKNDQTGERPRDPRHLYANPLQPEICPVLSLGKIIDNYRYIFGVFHS